MPILAYCPKMGQFIKVTINTRRSSVIFWGTAFVGSASDA